MLRRQRPAPLADAFYHVAGRRRCPDGEGRVRRLHVASHSLRYESTSSLLSKHF